MAQLRCENVALGYEAKVILEGLHFTVYPGDYLCIVGENGSGKSTLLKTVLGLKSPLKGTIETGDGLKQNEIGYLPQQTAVQRDFPASVKEIVLSGCQGRCGMRPFYNRQEKRLAEENIRKMGIESLQNRCYRELSGSGLDPRVTAEMYRLIWELNQKDNITVIMISHDIAAALTYATHILHIGRDLFFGTKNEYLQSETGKLFSGQEGGVEK